MLFFKSLLTAAAEAAREEAERTIAFETSMPLRCSCAEQRTPGGQERSAEVAAV